jgi:hypothetical protein
MYFVDLLVLSFGNLICSKSKARYKYFGVSTFTVQSNTKTLSDRDSDNFSASNREDWSFVTWRFRNFGFMAVLYTVESRCERLFPKS